MPAALVVATTSNMLRAVSPALGSSSPGEVLKRVNETLLAGEVLPESAVLVMGGKKPSIV
jgi:hypothetical protein